MPHEKSDCSKFKTLQQQSSIVYSYVAPTLPTFLQVPVGSSIVAHYWGSGTGGATFLKSSNNLAIEHASANKLECFFPIHQCKIRNMVVYKLHIKLLRQRKFTNVVLHCV